METAAGVCYYPSGRHAGETAPGSPVVVRYADDLIALCHSREAAEQVKERLEKWLTPRGLVFNEDKTRIVHAENGFDFLGFNVRRYPRCGKLLIKPSGTAVTRLRKRLREEFRALRGAPPLAVLRKINPIVRGWSAYYRTVVSKEVFGDRETGAYLVRFSWTKIIRHKLVKGTASPDDPALTSYWDQRRRRAVPLPLDRATMRLLRQQQGRCQTCGRLLLHTDQAPQSPTGWELWLRTTRKAMKANHIAVEAAETSDGVQPRLAHTACLRRDTKALRAHEPTGLA
jgi:RNA-directed DNA polymerase